MGVASGLSSCFPDSMLGVGGYSKGAEGSPAEGSPAEYIPADCRPLIEAECGVRTDEADRSASEGKLPEVGVARAASLGRFAGGIVTK